MSFPEQLAYGGGVSTSLMDPSAKMARMPTLRERIAMAVKQAEDRLQATKRAQELFEKNPDLEELFNIMQNGHF